MSNDRENSDLVKLLERPHAEYKSATGQDDYCCAHCGAEMMVTEVEFEANYENFVSGTRGWEREPMISQRLKIIAYVSHRCSAQRAGLTPWSDDCTMVELAYEF